MAKLTVQVTNGVALYARSLASLMPEALEQGVLRAAQATAGVLRRQTRETFPTGRTGALSRSFRETFMGWADGGVSAGALSDLVYADILDRGGTINPRGRFLAVPILAGKRLPVGKWPRHFAKGELQMIPRKGKDSLLARVKRNGRIDPLFVLKRNVRIRGRDYIEQAYTKAEPLIAEILGDAASGATEKASGK